jgi:hypothetical protein
MRKEIHDMSIQHHNPDDDSAQRRMIEEIIGQAQRKWPHGRVSGDDDGETAFAIAADPRYKIIRIQFTKPMNWLGLDVASAKQLIRLLTEKTEELERAGVH